MLTNVNDENVGMAGGLRVTRGLKLWKRKKTSVFQTLKFRTIPFTLEFTLVFSLGALSRPKAFGGYPATTLENCFNFLKSEGGLAPSGQRQIVCDVVNRYRLDQFSESLC